MKIKRWIIIRNGQETRLVSRRPDLERNEVGIEVTIDAPSPSRIVGQIEINLPEPPPATAEASAIEYGDDDE